MYAVRPRCQHGNRLAQTSHHQTAQTLDGQTDLQPDPQTQPTQRRKRQPIHQRSKLHHRQGHVRQRLVGGRPQLPGHVRCHGQGHDGFGYQELHLLRDIARFRRRTRHPIHVAPSPNGLLLHDEPRLFVRHR
uniref:(northern house mosquito) hypothetical protein n=1 Tax=Culex pipiens TaxID=7175 RepID=A0A8D8N3V8_CULPI